MATLNSDTFETNGSWTDTVGSGFSVVSSGAQEGTKCLEFSLSGGTGSVRYAVSAVGTIYIQLWLKVASGNGTFLELYDGSGNRILIMYTDSSRKLGLWETGMTPALSAGSLSLNTWYRINATITKGAGTGTYSVSLDGTQVISGSDGTFGVNDIVFVWLGAKSYSETGVYYVDAFEARDDAFSSPNATAYTLTGPAGDLTRNTQSGDFTVTPNGEPAADTEVTPDDDGAGGEFSPTSVTLEEGDDSAKTFKYTPRGVADGATVSISCTNDEDLTDPAAVEKTVNVVFTAFRITAAPTLLVPAENHVIDYSDAATGNVT